MFPLLLYVEGDIVNAEVVSDFMLAVKNAMYQLTVLNLQSFFWHLACLTVCLIVIRVALMIFDSAK